MTGEDIEREKLVAAIREDRCPDCGHLGFDDGPRGGAGINLFCRHCNSGFNVATPRYVMFAQRIGKRA